MEEQNLPKLKYLIEGLLFASGEPLSQNKIKDLLNSQASAIEEAINDLLNDYQLENRCLDIIKKGEEGGIFYQIVTNKNISQIIQKLNNTVLDGDLTKSGLEVLSIVMYRSPLNRAEIDEIRGVNSSYILRALTLRGLINRYQNPNRRNEYLYEPSFDILRHLGITSLDQLPKYEDFNQISLTDILSKAEKQTPEEHGSGENEA